MARGLVFGNINSAVEINTLLHGEQVEIWQVKKTSFSLNIVIGMLEGRGMKILKKFNENFRCIVIAERI